MHTLRRKQKITPERGHIYPWGVWAENLSVYVRAFPNRDFAGLSRDFSLDILVRTCYNGGQSRTTSKERIA